MKIYQHPENCGISRNLTSQQSFLKFLQLQGVTQLCFCMLLVKLKCLSGKEKLRLLNTIGVSCKVSDIIVEDVEKFIQAVCYPGRQEEIFTKTKVRLYK